MRRPSRAPPVSCQMQPRCSHPDGQIISDNLPFYTCPPIVASFKSPPGLPVPSQLPMPRSSISLEFTSGHSSLTEAMISESPRGGCVSLRVCVCRQHATSDARPQEALTSLTTASAPIHLRLVSAPEKQPSNPQPSEVGWPCPVLVCQCHSCDS